MSYKINKFLLSSILLIGTLFAYSAVVLEFIDFYVNEGTLLKVENCIVPNPITTACFYGAFGFLVALIWNIRIVKITEIQNRIKSQLYITLFLLGGSIFAWYNNFSTLYNYFIVKPDSLIGCSGQIVSNPFTTPCFIGATIFTIALIVSLSLYLNAKRKN
jgi:hypothetical protein